MADSDALRDWRDGSSQELLPLRPGLGTPAPRITEPANEPDQTVGRLALYAALVGALLVDMLLLSSSSWSTSHTLHVVIEASSAVVAFLLGALALMRYYTKGHTALLFIGAGFLGAGLLDLYHVALSASWLGPPGLQAPRLWDWSWFASRTFLATALMAGWIRGAGRRSGRSLPIRERIVYLGALVVPLVIMALFLSLPLPAYVFPGLPLDRPYELIPGLLFVGTLGLYLRDGSWRNDVVEHWMVITLLLSASADLLFMPFATDSFGPFFDAAHMIKLIAYLSALVGLLAGFFVASRREEEVMGQLRDANDALAREISVRRAAEQVLMEGERRLQDFLDNANDLIQSTAPDGRIIYVNRAWKETLGYGDRPMEGLSIFSIVHPACRERVRREFDRLISGEDISSIEVEFMTADGRVVICAGGVNCLVEGDRVVAVRSIFRDVTQQKMAEGSLELSQANLTALIENTGDAIWSVGRDHRLITFNSAYALEVEALTGREPRVTDPPERVVAFQKIEWIRDLYNQALSGQRFSKLRTETVAGQTRTVELFFNPIQDQKGTSGVVVFGKDVTPRLLAEEAIRAAKEEAEAANQAKSRFLANMSHELRTPLNSVIGFANVLMKNKGGRLSEKDLNFMQRIVSNGRHLLTLINEVLDLAKIESGRMDLELSVVDLGDLVRETTQQIEGQVRDKPVELLTRIPDGLEAIETDGHKLKQVLINLIGNAIKFTAEGSVTVSVRASRNGTHAEAIEVRDTGLGIPAERLEAIFEAFQQADSGTSRRFGGTGLGLTISRSMVQLLGGELLVESEEGKGAVFTVRLPGPSPVRNSVGRNEPEQILERLAALPERRVMGGT